ncbi:MAG TPA: hypothetical protein PKY59_19075 [Pyrinomonadaceae bacterium]|nr:hypothetical protein [Pyrinomonadaceae bacterium]
MKNIVKIFLVLVLFCTAVLADDGNMGNGNKNCQSGCLVENQTMPVDKDNAENTVIKFVRQYLLSIFG